MNELQFITPTGAQLRHGRAIHHQRCVGGMVAMRRQVDLTDKHASFPGLVCRKCIASARRLRRVCVCRNVFNEFVITSPSSSSWLIEEGERLARRDGFKQ